MVSRVIYSCPSLAQCSWQGGLSEIVGHFRSKHIELLLVENQFRLVVPSFDISDHFRTIGYEYAINYLLCANDEVYLLQVNVVNGKATIRIRYSGSAVDASRKRYSIQVRSGDMTQTSNIKSSMFYSAVRKQPGMIEIDAQFLRNAWKIDDYLTCCIHFEDLGGEVATGDEEKPVAQPPPPKRPFLHISKSLEDFTSIPEDQEDQQADVTVATTPAARNTPGRKDGAHLIRSASEQSRTRMDRKGIFRSSLFKRNSVHKSEQSLFYTDQEYLDSSAVDGLLDLAEDRIALLNDYRCNQCEVYIAGPIYRCANEHSICHGCFEECGKCGCGADLSAEQRSIPLEMTRDCTKLPCRFSGCAVSAIGAELQMHQVQCNHCVYMCPECKACIGKYSDVEKHFRIVHPSVKRVTNLENAFPSKATLLVLHAQGVFYCRSSEGASSVDWHVEHCGHVKIYFECEVVIKKNTYVLAAARERNVLRRSVSLKEKKQKSGATLKIHVYESHS